MGLLINFGWALGLYLMKNNSSLKRPFFQNFVYLFVFFFFNVILPNMSQLNLIYNIDLVFSIVIGTNLVFNKHKISKSKFYPLVPT